MPIATAKVTDWTEVWYPATISALTQIAGPGFRDPNTGATMPRMSSVATIAFLGLVTPAVARVLEDYVKVAQNRDSSKVATYSRLLTDEGELNAGADTAESLAIDAKTYLGYTPDVFELGIKSGAPWQRYRPGAYDFGLAFEVYFIDSYDTANDIRTRHAFIRQLIADWQRAVDAASAAIRENATDTTQPAPQYHLSEFLSAIRAICSDLDALRMESPEFNRIADALRYSLAKTSEFVGQAAAEVANEAGKLAGIVGENALEGFLTNAGIYSFIVVGIVIYLFI